MATRRIRNKQGNSVYRNEQGRQVSKEQIEEYYSDTSFREALYKQRVQSAQVEHLLREDYPMQHRPPAFDQARDDRLSEFAQTPRSKRTTEMWQQWEQDMTAIYGDDRDDWGDYA